MALARRTTCRATINLTQGGNYCVVKPDAPARLAALAASYGAHAAEAIQRFLDLPWFREGIRLRTRFIDDAVRDALDAGVRQLVILGAGFDMRGRGCQTSGLTPERMPERIPAGAP